MVFYVCRDLLLTLGVLTAISCSNTASNSPLDAQADAKDPPVRPDTTLPQPVHGVQIATPLMLANDRHYNCFFWRSPADKDMEISQIRMRASDQSAAVAIATELKPAEFPEGVADCFGPSDDEFLFATARLDETVNMPTNVALHVPKGSLLMIRVITKADTKANTPVAVTINFETLADGVVPQRAGLSYIRPYRLRPSPPEPVQYPLQFKFSLACPVPPDATVFRLTQRPRIRG
jgi:hypothetical protein